MSHCDTCTCAPPPPKGADDYARAQAILYDAAAKHGTTVAAIKSRSRRPEEVMARQEAAYGIYKQTDLPLKLIGLLVGRHYSTIIHSINVVSERRVLGHDDPFIWPQQREYERRKKRILELHEERLSSVQIAERLGISTRTVYRALDQAGVYPARVIRRRAS